MFCITITHYKISTLTERQCELGQRTGSRSLIPVIVPMYLQNLIACTTINFSTCEPINKDEEACQHTAGHLTPQSQKASETAFQQKYGYDILPSHTLQEVSQIHMG
jgi:hypothetical protein